MSRRIVFIGNCQTRALHRLYEQYCAQHLSDHVSYIESYEKIRDKDRLTLHQADLVIEQLVDVQPQGAVTELETEAPRILVPLVACGFLWPFAGQPHPANQKTWFTPGGSYPGENSDRYLNKLIGQGATPEEALEKYSLLDVNELVNLDRLYELVIDRQRRRDQVCGFDIAPLIEENFRTERLFTTPHHPGLRVAMAVVEQLFRKMGVPEICIASLRANTKRSPLAWNEVPIHPSIIRHFGLTYVDEHTRYRYSVDGYVTFRQWVLRYMRGEWNADLEEGIALSATDPKSALAKLEPGLERSPSSPDGYFAKGEALRRLGDFEHAEECFRKGIGLCADEPRFHYALAVTLRSLGRWQESLAEARIAIAGEPSNPHFHAAAAHAAWSGKLFGDAEGFARRAIELNPGGAGLHNLLSHLLYEQGRFAEAEAEAQQAVSLDPRDFHFHLNYGRVLEALGKREDAETSVAAAIKLCPENAELHTHLGHLRAHLVFSSKQLHLLRRRFGYLLVIRHFIVGSVMPLTEWGGLRMRFWRQGGRSTWGATARLTTLISGICCGQVMIFWVPPRHTKRR